MSTQPKIDIYKRIDSCVLNYKTGNRRALDNIYNYLFNYCLRVISRTCGKYIKGDDVEASIVPSAIFTLADKYDYCKYGPFLIYLGQAIKSLALKEILIQEGQARMFLSLADPDTLVSYQEPDYRFFENIIIDLARKEEIEILDKFLSDFEIHFQDLGQICPRQQKTRALAQKAAQIICKDQYLCDFIFSRKIMPSKALEEVYKLNRSVLDKYWKYIVAVTIVLKHDLQYLRPYFLSTQRGG